LWGAGKNGKDMAKLLQSYDDKFHWVCDNRRKIGKEIYGVQLEHYESILTKGNTQIIIIVASPTGKKEIEEQLISWNKKPVVDFWFFA
jgi:hypothetical protein